MQTKKVGIKTDKVHPTICLEFLFSDAINFKSTLAGLDRGYLKVTIFAGTSAADWPKNAKFCTRYVPANNCHLKVIFPPTITCICIQYLSTNIQFSAHVSLTLY